MAISTLCCSAFLSEISVTLPDGDGRINGLETLARSNAFLRAPVTAPACSSPRAPCALASPAAALRSARRQTLKSPLTGACPSLFLLRVT